MMSLQCEPGSAYNYSNAGTNTVGRIIEVVSDMPYEDFLDARIIRPLGMVDTTFWPSESQLTRLANTYRKNTETGQLEEMLLTHQFRYPLSDRTRYPMPAGGLFSTVDDIGRFCQMLVNGGEWEGVRYLSPGALAEMTRRQTPAGVAQSYGLSWDVGDGFFGHGGGAGTLMSVFPRAGVIVSFMTSQEALHEEVHKARWDLAMAAVAEASSL
jgi:CubicO group peptidase (beta-lactamase class C family)